METWDNISHIDNNKNITLGVNTKLNDWTGANFVKKKCLNGYCMSSESEEFVRTGRNVEAVNLHSATCLKDIDK
jgi:hypothetical protein